MTDQESTLHSVVASGRIIGGGEEFVVADPAHPQRIVSRFHACTPNEVEEAVKAAREAARDWGRRPVEDRSQILLAAASLLHQRMDSVATEMVAEMGKTISEAKGEVTAAVRSLQYYAGQATTPTGRILPSSERSRRILAERVPVGVVGCITPWNFPLLIPTYKVAPGLVFGNGIVLKPAEESPRPVVRLAEILIEAGLPEGLFNVCLGGPETGAALVESSVDAVSFTGSSEVGTLISRSLAGTHKKLQLEMGGKNAAVVFEDADLDQAADLITSASTGMCGQRCTATSRVVAVGAAYDQILGRLKDRFERIRVGDPMLPETEMGPLVSRRQFEKVKEAIAAAESQLTRATSARPVPDEGYFVPPTIFQDVEPSSPLAQEEVFGPVLALLAARDDDEAVEIANGTPYGLAASVFSRSLSLALETADRLEAGVVHVNSQGPLIERYAPFGGMKNSGYGGREQGEGAREFYTDWKTTYINW